jgi:hypothetical protein
MKLYTPVLAWTAASLMLLGACSKTKDTEEVTDELDGAGEEHNSLPALSTAGTIVRQGDGLWHETNGGNIFSGTVVHEQDSICWEEKYEKGVRVFVRAWDEDGSPVVLHSWNADGSPAD